ncbi:MAG: hypothetical protein GWP17_00050 [Aquificales bacterium]|nr:hypothetical protein [Aquificales bacterium]
MAKQWACTPGTVSRAYAILSQEGLAAGQRGSGTHIMPNALLPEDATRRWAGLVNRADQFLLAAVSGGHSPAQAEAALKLAISRWQELKRQAVPPTRTEATKETAVLHLAGSHDLTLGFLARLLEAEQPELQLILQYVGSLGGLIALAQGEADIAGTHLWDEATDSYNLPFVQRLLPGRRVLLLTLVKRSLGLMTAPGNPHGLQGLADLARPNIRLVNRQSGSGTRVWLDAQLKALAIKPAQLAGYEREEVTHMAIALAIKQREADAGLGIQAAATAYGLDFIPLTQERYDLVFPEAVWQTPAAQLLAAIIRADRFKESVMGLAGYDTAVTGQEIRYP